MRRSLFLLSLWALLVSGCTFLPQPPDVEKISGAKVENPFFRIPPENLKDYQDRSWILLAESSNKNWFYDPYTLSEDEDGITTFDMFIVDRENDPRLQPFNASSIGPFRQKIDCFSNYQWSEIFYADKMPKQENYSNPLKPNQEWGWIKIKPRTSMAYIRARICGRKFIDDKNVNYFLYQEGDFASTKISQDNVKQQSILDSGLSSKPLKEGAPIFYEVVNNEIVIVDAKKDIRQLRIASYNLDKNFSRRGDYIFQANCQSKFYRFAPQGQALKTQELGSAKDAFANVAFNRVCGDHGKYMQVISRQGR